MKLRGIFGKKVKMKDRLNFKNSVTLYAAGYNLERSLNMLCSKNVDILSVRKLDVKNSVIEVLACDEKYVVDFLRGKNIEIKRKKYNGIARINKFFLLRYGLLIGAFLAFCFFVVASNYVWKIEGIGNKTRTQTEIVELLNQNGVNIFDALNEKTNEEIEKILLDNLEEVSMVSVIKKGTTILINIKEKLLNDEHENLGEYTALLATIDGIISRIELIQGTLNVKVGDMVRIGNELVLPYVKDSSGQTIPIQPKANIYLETWLTGESVHFDVKAVVERTGNVEIERKITFLNQEIFTQKPDVTFAHYETECNETYLSDSLMPIKYITTYYHETELKFIEQSFDEVENDKIMEAKDLARMQLKERDTIKSENHIITSSNGRTTVSYVITIERKIF
jgi:sporulation protein YqfD